MKKTLILLALLFLPLITLFAMPFDEAIDDITSHGSFMDRGSESVFLFDEGIDSEEGAASAVSQAATIFYMVRSDMFPIEGSHPISQIKGLDAICVPYEDMIFRFHMYSLSDISPSEYDVLGEDGFFSKIAGIVEYHNDQFSYSLW